MHLLTRIACLFVLLFLWSCEANPTAIETKAAVDEGNNSPLDLLIFLNEQKAELWANIEGKSQFIRTFPISCPPKTPIGIFDWPDLEFPNPFYQNKIKKESLQVNSFYQLEIKAIQNLHQVLSDNNKVLSPSEQSAIHQLFIFPNDARQSTAFKATYASSHWMAELYGQLWLELKGYQKEGR